MDNETHGIVAIVPHLQNGFHPLVHGMGILVNKREILTCAHVVEDALKGSNGHDSHSRPIRVSFPFANGDTRDGIVDNRRYFPPAVAQWSIPTDVAIIHLDADAPKAAKF